MDVAYIVRPGDDNEELRYSLRSLVNVPHERVWIVGYKPSWVTGVEYVQVEQAPLRHLTKRENAWANMRALAASDAGPDVLYMDDDYFILSRVKEVPPMHRGALAEHAGAYKRRYARSHYTSLLLHTLGYLGRDALSFECHVPFPVDRRLLADVLDECEANEKPIGQMTLRPMWRTVYGNRHHPDAPQVRDPKNPGGGIPVGATYLSTSDSTFARTGGRLAVRFPRRSPYEQ